MLRSTRATRLNFASVALVLALLTLYVVPGAAAAPAAVLTIDHFDTVQGPLIASIGSPASSSVSGANILGVERDMQISVPSGSAASASARALDSQLMHSQDSGVFAQTLVQWDGVDGTMTLNPTGLGGVDLTQGNTQNGLAVTVLLNDLPIDLKFTVYSGANSSTTTLTLPGGQPSTAGAKDYYIPYAAFATLAGSGADFTNVGAVELLIDGYNDATDLTIGEIRTAEFDWGDLPDSSVGGPDYPTQYADNGPRHLIGSLYLGSLIDPFEVNGAPSVGATGDNVSGQDDEDGVQPTNGVLWDAGLNGGSVDVTVTGGPGCLSAWVDWNNNGSLTDAGDNILSNVLVNTGTTTHTFFIPTDPASGSFYARFRLYATDPGNVCTSSKAPTGQAVNGEVEDYQWSFGPNAVSISAFSGTSAASALPSALPVVSGLVASVTAVFVAVRRVLRG